MNQPLCEDNYKQTCSLSSKLLKGRIMTEQERFLYESQLKGFLDAYDCLTMRLLDAVRYARHIERFNVKTESAGVLERMVLDAEHDFDMFRDIAKGLEAIIRGKPEEYFEDFQPEMAEA